MKFASSHNSFSLLIGLLVLMLAACQPTTQDLENVGEDFIPETIIPGAEVLEGIDPSDLLVEATHLYVATDGMDEGNDCTDINEPCLTPRQAIAEERAAGGFHHIHLDAGTYTNPFGEYDRSQPFTLSPDGGGIILQGAGRDATILQSIDGQASLNLAGSGYVRVQDLTIQGSPGSGQAIGLLILDEITAGIPVDLQVDVTDARFGYLGNFGAGLVTLTNVEIAGNGPDVEAAGLDNQGSMVITNSQLIDVERGLSNEGDLSISNSQITNGLYGIINYGNLNATNLLIDTCNNPADTTGTTQTGIKHYEGTSSLSAITIQNCDYGLEILGADSVVTIDGSLIRANAGIGILQNEGQLAISNTMIRDHPNVTISVGEDATAAIEYSTLENNRAGIFNDGNLTISYSRFHSNSGGAAVHNQAGQAMVSFSEFTENVIYDRAANLVTNSTETPALTISHSLFANNRSTEDVAILRGVMEVSNSTISNNTGIGINIWADSRLQYSTIVGNSLIGFDGQWNIGTEGQTRIHDVIIAGNGRDCFHLNDGFLFSGYNLDSDGSCPVDATYSMADMGLGPLADNGGATMTHALLDGSPAIDATSYNCPDDDQRGAGRPNGSDCDVGSFEVGETVASVPIGAPDDLLVTISDDAPAADELVVVPDQNYNCRYGNSSAFDIADTLLQGQEYLPTGIGPDGLWFQFEGPTYGTLCWAPTSGFILFLGGVEIPLVEVPDTILATIIYPAEPTPTEDPDESYDVTPTPVPPQPSPTLKCDPKQQQCP